MTALERTQHAELSHLRQSLPADPLVVERVVVRTVEVPVARPSTWQQMAPEARFAAVAVIALGVLVFLSLFALAGQGSAATGLAVGIILGAAAFGTLLAVVMWRTAR